MSEKPKRKRSPRRVYLIAATLLIPILALQILFSRSVDVWKPETREYISPTFASAVDVDNAAQSDGAEAKNAIVKLVGNALPASAANFAYYEVRLRDMAAWMRFDIAPDDFQNWLHQAKRVCTELIDQEMPSFSFSISSLVNWWHPETASRYAGASCYEPGEYYSILVDMTQGNSWTVYLEI